jgi:hypothetical protein
MVLLSSSTIFMTPMLKNYQRFSVAGWPTQTAAMDHVPHRCCGDVGSGGAGSGDVGSDGVGSGGASSAIRAVVAIALQTGWLSLEAENRLRRLMARPYAQEDFRAIVVLQRAAMEQRVIQESRQRLMLQMRQPPAESRAKATLDPKVDRCRAIA